MHCPHVIRGRAWMLVAVLCAGITIYFSGSIARHQRRAQQGFERFILLGPNGQIDTIMHYVTTDRRDGETMQLDVSGTATLANVKDAVRAFTTGDDTPPGWKVTKWDIAGGSTITVRTPPIDGETTQEHCDRHDKFVEELQEEFPPV